MCMLFLYINTDPKEKEYRLILASNRDEYFTRPAKQAYFCKESNTIGGRDMEDGREGGMWLGIAIKANGKKKLCIGTLLNILGEPKSQDPQGRGYIVRDFLTTKKSMLDYIDSLDTKNGTYSGFNFVCSELSADGATTYCCSNAPSSIKTFKNSQVLAFGNSPLTSPLKKVENGKKQFEVIVKKSLRDDNLVNELLQFLKSTEHNLPDPELVKRVGEVYKGLSSIFVNIQDTYGTRTHTIVLVDYNWQVEYIEDTLEEPINPKKLKWKRTCINTCVC